MLKHAFTAFVVGASIFAGLAFAQQRVFGERFVTSEHSRFVYDLVEKRWLYPWTWNETEQSAGGVLGLLTP